MTNVDAWQFDLEGYLREAEPDAAERADAWQTGIGLQAVDALPVSDYLLETAQEHIEGAISIDEAQRRISSYYETRANRHDTEAGDTKEGDLVSSRIARLLNERAFVFSPVQLKSIHRSLFQGLLAGAGEYRTYNITKKEWVLNGDTVLYSPATIIEEALEYDFEQEKRVNYRGMSRMTALRHMSEFVSGIWQIHPFCEGNTRTTAVFAIKYLKTLGFRTGNDPFKQHSWYFRNALVRANYENLEKGIHPTRQHLDRFFENLLLGARHELKNRCLHVDWPADERPAGSTHEVADQVADQVTDQVKALLAVLGDAELSARELMERLGLSHRPTFRQNYLQPALDAGLIERTIPDKPTSRLQRYRRVRDHDR